MGVEEIEPMVLGANLHASDGSVLGQVREVHAAPTGGFVVEITRSPATALSVTIDEPAAVELGRLVQVSPDQLIPQLALTVEERWSADASIVLPGFDDEQRPVPPPPPPPPRHRA